MFLRLHEALPGQIQHSGLGEFNNIFEGEFKISAFVNKDSRFCNLGVHVYKSP
jgi:hypothetical protein